MFECEDSSSVSLSDEKLKIIQQHLHEIWGIKFQKVSEGTLTTVFDSRRRIKQFDTRWQNYVDGSVCRSYHIIDERELLDKLDVSHDLGIEVCLDKINRGAKHIYHLYVYETTYLN